MSNGSFGFGHCRNFYRSYLLIVAVCLLFGISTRASAEGSAEYKFGVFPFMPMAALIKYFNSVAIDFTRQVNKRFFAQSRTTFKQFSEEIEKETYDIIFVQPFDYPAAYEHNYVPLARRQGPLEAILATKIDSDIKSIADLAGKTLASPPKESSISIIIEKDLAALGLSGERAVSMVYTSNHFACMQMVLVGKADACSTTTPVLIHWQSTELKKQKLHSIHQSNSIPNTLYMVHKRVPEADREKLKKAILTWGERPEGKMILKLFNQEPFVQANDSEYDVIRNYFK